MPSEWYVSFHGGDEKDSLNNIHVYSSDGHEVRKALNTKSLAAGVTLRELRGFVLGPDRSLYVVNSYYKYSEVLKFKGALNKDGQHDFVDIFAKRDASSNPGLSHPFNAVFDSEGDLYVVDGLWSMVQVFNRQGQLLYYFGSRGAGNGQFQLPAGLFIDHQDRVFVVDSFNRRIQVFHYYRLPKTASGGMQ